MTWKSSLSTDARKASPKEKILCKKKGLRALFRIQQFTTIPYASEYGYDSGFRIYHTLSKFLVFYLFFLSKKNKIYCKKGKTFYMYIDVGTKTFLNRYGKSQSNGCEFHRYLWISNWRNSEISKNCGESAFLPPPGDCRAAPCSLNCRSSSELWCLIGGKII